MTEQKPKLKKWSEEWKARVRQSMIVRGIWHSDRPIHKIRRPDCSKCIEEEYKKRMHG